MAAKLIPITIYLPQKLADKLKSLALRNRRSRTKQIEEMLAATIAPNKK
tara:strand:+ start:188 stop:334 length:147 start_codon:yes stop_codon:yes gene_type:complete